MEVDVSAGNLAAANRGEILPTLMLILPMWLGMKYLRRTSAIATKADKSPFELQGLIASGTFFLVIAFEL